jgi:RecA/RadA recombinase
VSVSNVVPLFPSLIDVRVPAELRDLPQWLCWKYELSPGETKPRKMPFWADGARRHGQQGGALDRERLVTFEVAREAAIRLNCDGVGFAPLPGCGYTFLDFDNCVTDGKLPPEIEAIVGRTYAEYSPSGKGVRAVLKGDLGNRKSHDQPYGFEAFSSKGYVTFTGNILPLSDMLGGPDYIASVDDATRALAEARFGRQEGIVDEDDPFAGLEPRLGLSIVEMERILSYLDPGMGRDGWLRVGMALHHETQGDDTGLDIWDSWSGMGHNYQGPEDLRYAWERFEQRMGRRSVTMASVIKMAQQKGYDARKTPDEVMARAEEILVNNERGPFYAMSYRELMQQPPQEWIIKGILPKDELGIIFGASGSGKSFVALDMACAIARGVDWWGRRTTPGKVVIVAAEGGSGYRKRLRAYATYHGLSEQEFDNIRVVIAAPNFLEGDDVAEVIAEIKSHGDVTALILDTLAQVTPGANENTSEDMGQALANIKTMHRATGVMPLVVHHAGKDLTKGSRGWSGLKGAAAVQLEVLRHDGFRELVVEKMKDGEDGMRFAFKLEQVNLGTDADGDPVTSCVVVPIEAPRTAPEIGKQVKRRGRIETHILETMHTFGDRDAVSVQELVDAAVAELPEPEEGKRDTRRQHVTRAITNLSKEKDGPLQVVGNRVVFYE